MLTPVLLSPDICPAFANSTDPDQLASETDLDLHWVCTCCHPVCEFVSTTWIKLSDWLTIKSGCGILIYSVWQGKFCL